MKNRMFIKSIAASLALVTAASAFAGATGATYNVLDITTSTGQKAFKAECHGLFSSSSSCMAAAQKVCGSLPVNVLQIAEDAAKPGDARELIFDCQSPAQPQPAQAPVQPAPVPAPAPVVRKVTLDEKTNFDFDSAVLKPRAKATLDKLIAEDSGTTFSNVSIEGYTDSTGSAAYNVGLSQRRAKSVLDYLQGHGMKSNNFAVKGFGKDNPVASNATAAGRAQNRRVEVILTK
jgi:OmpA-OmpF porin, OOP family